MSIREKMANKKIVIKVLVPCIQCTPDIVATFIVAIRI